MKEKKGLRQDKRSGKQMVLTSVVLVLLALVSVTAATLAWFSIADRTRVKSMSMEITTGANLRFDLDKHDVFEQYVKTLSFENIAARIQREKGYDMKEVPLEPVTTSNYTSFTLENGTVVESREGKYLEFTLHFMALEDMIVHLTSANSHGNHDGSSVTSGTGELPKAMRISFTVDGQTRVYDPGMGDTAVNTGNTRIFGLPSAGSMRYNKNNILFPLKKEIDKAVLVHIWLEGTDEACTDALRGADYSIQLRFVGTDENGVVLDGESKE